MTSPSPRHGVNIESPGRRSRCPAILAYGFRPFFLLAGLHALVAVPLWIAALGGFDLLSPAMPARVWHAHEMLYGFIAAAMAGFLLTAVPSWTNRRGYAGLPLAMLALLWLAGRSVMSLPTGLPPSMVALIDLAFLPALALMILPALLRSGNRRNLVFVALLLLLFGANLHFHLSGADSSRPLLAGINTVLLLITLLGGRIVPAFTSAALKQLGEEARIRRFLPLDKAALAAVGAVLAVDLVMPESQLAAAVALLAAVLLALQLGHWQGHRTLSMPIVWILHLAYAWLPLAFALKAAALAGLPVAAGAWLHAATAGAMASMIVGVMSRAALGHTGRPLIAPRPIVVAYLALAAAAVSRVFGPLLLPTAATSWLQLAALLWCLAFLLYLVVYAPILCRARIDGRPG